MGSGAKEGEDGLVGGLEGQDGLMEWEWAWDRDQGNGNLILHTHGHHWEDPVSYRGSPGPGGFGVSCECADDGIKRCI